jgi:hypothetical protein
VVIRTGNPGHTQSQRNLVSSWRLGNRSVRPIALRAQTWKSVARRYDGVVIMNGAISSRTEVLE